MSICIHSAQNVEVSLERGKVFGFQTGNSVVLSCVEGCIWVTAPSTDDVILRPNQSMTMSSSGRIVVQALSGARFQFSEQRSSRAAA